MVSPAATGLQPRRRIFCQVPLRTIRSKRPRSMSEKYMPLLTCIAMSMSVGSTRSGRDAESQTLSGGRLADLNEHQECSQEQVHDHHVTRE